MSEVQEQVKKIIVDHLGIDESKVLPEAKFNRDSIIQLRISRIVKLT